MSLKEYYIVKDILSTFYRLNLYEGYRNDPPMDRLLHCGEMNEAYAIFAE